MPMGTACGIGDLKDRSVRVSCGETAALLNGRGAVVNAEHGKTFRGQPPAEPTISTAHIQDEMIFRKPAGVDRFNELLLRLVGCPQRAKFRIEPLTLPSTQASPVHPIGK